MSQVVEQFGNKKLSGYLSPGQRNLIVFYHGLGDLLMFYPLFTYLKSLCPDIQFDLGLEGGCGFHEYFGAIPFPTVHDWASLDYDYVFILKFPMSEGNGHTKAEYCCMEELGIDPLPTSHPHPLPVTYNPLVAVHFQGTCLPGQTNPSEEVARQIWEEIKSCGYIPIEVHFQHVYHNPTNARWDWVTRGVRDVDPQISKLTGLLSNCAAFVGVASGPFVVALGIMPNKCFYLQKHHKLSTYTTLDIPTANVDDYQGEVKEWLRDV